ncbi:MAG: DinB family protein [Saprospiraceae bacterium]|nr:DinB family protein [Saprospiraceae bacterium]
MKTEITRIINTIRHTFEGTPWHGPAVMDILKDIKPEDVIKKLPNSHNIAELVAHMSTWREFVAQKLNGNIEFDVTHEANFPVITNLTKEDWQALVNRLQKSQSDLLKALEHCSDEKLGELVPGREYKFGIMLHGIIHHDLYHLGQIVLLRKLP